VAPRSPNVDAFAANLERAGSWLTPFGGFGPDNFLVGRPDFHFADYREWIAARFPPNRFRQLEEKMDWPTLYAIGAFIQALGQNPGLEEELTRLGTRAHVYVGTGIGSISGIAEGARSLDRAQRRWDRFWAEKNPGLAAHLAASPEERAARRPDAPALPADLPPEERPEAEEIWWHYWAGCSPDLAAYLEELRQIESVGVDGDIESGKISMLKEKQRRYAQLQKRWQAPEPPWRSVSANLIWNIHNTPASQISMLGRITGLAFAPAPAPSLGTCPPASPRHSQGATPAAARACRMAAVGPSFEGVMMWSASALTPTATGSMPSGRKPRAVMRSRSPRIHSTEPPATWVPRSAVRGFETAASAEITRAL